MLLRLLVLNYGIVSRYISLHRCLLANPTAHEGSFFVVVPYCSGSVVGQPWCLAVLGYRQHVLFCEGKPLWTLAVISQLCVVVSCCYIFGWAVVILVRLVVGYEYLHVTARGLAAVGSPQQLTQGIYHLFLRIIGAVLFLVPLSPV